MSVYWMIWDGAAAWIVDELLRRAALPHLARLVGRGATQAALVPSIPNCQTPPGLAALLTGTQPADNGVTGFFVPGDGNGDIAGWRRAFSPDVLTREPIWETAGRHGYTSILVHAPWGFDRDGQTADGVDLAVEAYQTRVARERAAFLGDLPVVWDDLPIVTAVRSAGSGPDQTVELVVGDRAVRLDERWVEVDTGSGSGAYFRVVVHPNGSRAVVRTPVYAPRCAGADADGVRDMRKSIAARTFVGDSMGSLLRDGWFGARLAEGGDGSAERIFLSGAQLVAGSFEAHLRAALERPRPDLLIAYVPMTDDVGHELAGLLTGETDMETREAAWDLVAEGYAMSDRLLGVLMESAQDDDTIVVAADHGIARVTSDLHVNAVLADAGLAVPAREGEAADHLQSSVHYHIVNNGLILRGLGPQTLDGEDTMSRAEAVLRGLRRPETDRPAVLGFVDAHGVPVTLGPGTNQAYLLLGEGVHPDADRAEGQHFGPPSRSASHTTYGGDRRLHAYFAVDGPHANPREEEKLTRNDQVAGLVLDTLAIARNRDRGERILLCVTGDSGAGKSTFVSILGDVCAARGRSLQRVRLASPLYRLQQLVREEAGVELAEDVQDQLLMESLARHLRRLNARALVDPAVRQVTQTDADVVVIDDLRDPDVDAPALRREGFRVVRIRAPRELRAARRVHRGDATTSDASTTELDHIPADKTIENHGSLADYRAAVEEYLEGVL